ncbi:glutathione-independent glyoxalase HSP31 [Aplysia californica]|uniref:Glutathione-independent glyoxalase HSP31 n=1 Tax=Aplysia californica TaxID=6500 RepID=A0ABM0JJK5_APLCA|nr:glutathione-independent glyoxalase HSP31 [Aplysia californica]
MGKKVLIVLTSADKIVPADKPTGWYLPELAHPYKVLVGAGFKDIDIISPKGGVAPLDPGSAEAFKEDSVCNWFLADATAKGLVANTKTPAQVKSSDYSAVLYPGGHGPMYDLATDAAVAKITAEVYDKGGIVAAVCHGPAGLVPVKLSNGESIVKGKNVTSFTNAEEDAVQLSQYMPFMLETKLKELGANFQPAGLFEEKVVVDGRLITGQNPASSTTLGQKLVAQLKN